MEKMTDEFEDILSEYFVLEYNNYVGQYDIHDAEEQKELARKIEKFRDKYPEEVEKRFKQETEELNFLITIFEISRIINTLSNFFVLF